MSGWSATRIGAGLSVARQPAQPREPGAGGHFTYDSRTVEFAETFQIPSFNVFAGKPFRLEDFWDQALFERFNRAYYQRYRDMRLFLDENRVPHKMLDEVAATARKPALAA